MLRQECIRVARLFRVYNLLRHNRAYHGVERRLNPGKRQEFSERMSRLRRFVGEAPYLAFDVGANCGQFSAPLLALGAKIVAVEPDPESAQILRIRFWGRRLKVEECALSDAPGSATFYREHPGSQRNSLIAEEVGSAVTMACSVRIDTLEHLIGRHGLPRFLKIDVEGNEPAVLRGLTTPISRVMFECNAPSASKDGILCVGFLAKINPHYEFSIATAGTVSPGEWSTGPYQVSDTLANCRSPVDVFARLPMSS